MSDKTFDMCDTVNVHEGTGVVTGFTEFMDCGFTRIKLDTPYRGKDVVVIRNDLVEAQSDE